MARTRRDEAGADGRTRRCGCGSALLASGRCKDTGDYPAALIACPISCPICRGPLTWAGECWRCLGTATPHDKASRTMPGDCYETVGVHRVKVCGPRRACTPAENTDALAIVRGLLDNELDAAMAGEILAQALAAHGPLPPPREDPPWEPGADG